MAKHKTIGIRVDEETEALYSTAAGVRTVSAWARDVLDNEVERLEAHRLGRALAAPQIGKFIPDDGSVYTVVLVKDGAGRWVEKRIRLGG